MRRIFDQWSAVQFAKYLIVHVLSTRYNVSSFELWNGKKATMQWGLRVAIDFVLNQVCLYQERVSADNVVSNFWFVRSSSSQHHSEYIANIANEIVSEVRTKECKTGSNNWKMHFISLRSSRHFDCERSFCMIASPLEESVLGFNNDCNGGVKTGFQIVNLDNFETFSIKNMNFPSVNFWYIDG